MEVQKQNSSWKHLLVVLIILIPVAYVAFMWDKIPDIIPVHFNAAMEADKHAPKSSIWGYVSILSGTSFLVYLLMANIHKIDPKRSKATNGNDGIMRLTIGIIVFITALNMIVVLKMINPGNTVMDMALLPLIGLLFVFIGNYIHSIKPNYFAGIKFPWTLASEYNWKKTHRFGGKLFFVSGLLIAASSFILPMEPAFIVTVALTLLIVIGTAVYSYRIFKKEGNNDGYYDKETTTGQV